MHLIVFFRHQENFNLLNSVAQLKFLLIFQLFLPSQINSLFKCRIVWNKIQFFISSFSSFYVNDKFFIRKILIFSTIQWMKFSLFFSFLCSWEPNSQSQFATVWKRIKFSISHFSSSILTTNFLKEKFSFSQSWIRQHQFNFPYFHFLVRLRHKFSIWICDSLKENSILHPLLFFFYPQHEFFIGKILILWKLNSSAPTQFSLFFSILCGWDTNSRSELLTVWKRIQFCISSFASSTKGTNFSYDKF